MRDPGRELLENSSYFQCFSSTKSYFCCDQLSWNGGAMQDAREGDWEVFFVIAKVHLQRDFYYTRSSKFEITAGFSPRFQLLRCASMGLEYLPLNLRKTSGFSKRC